MAKEEQNDAPRWNPKPSFYLVVPGKDSMVRVLEIEGTYIVTQDGKFRSLKGHVMSEHDMTVEEAGRFTMDPHEPLTA